MVANGIEFTRSDLAQGAKNLAGVADHITNVASTHIDDPVVATAPANRLLSNVPLISVQFGPAETYLQSVQDTAAKVTAAAKELGTATDLLSTAVTDMTKRYDAVIQADMYNADQLQQGLNLAEGVPGA